MEVVRSRVWNHRQKVCFGLGSSESRLLAKNMEFWSLLTGTQAYESDYRPLDASTKAYGSDYGLRLKSEGFGPRSLALGNPRSDPVTSVASTTQQRCNIGFFVACKTWKGTDFGYLQFSSKVVCIETSWEQLCSNSRSHNVFMRATLKFQSHTESLDESDLS